MKILVKFPSRERPAKFFETLKRCMELSVMPETKYLISLDHMDPIHQGYLRYLFDLDSECKNKIEVKLGYSRNKVSAINRDINEYTGEWDILVIVSDDQIAQVSGWDKIISDTMTEHYPNTNGTLWFYDGYQPRINTQCIIGKKYYNRFGYVYHPSYKSLWCDNEFTEVSAPITYKSDSCLFKHQHYSNDSNVKMDALMRKTESFYREDEVNFKLRKRNGFQI